MSREDWSLTPVADLAEGKKWAINGGPFGSKLVSRDYVNSGVPVIRGANLPFGKRFHSDDFVFVSEEKADELLANNAHPGDVIITQRGTLGQVGIIPRNSTYPRYVISQSQMKISVDPVYVDADWLYYCFRSPAYQNELINRASSSGVPHINLGVLREFKLPLPDLQSQRRIASILSAYDDLIENNARRIAILEEMARRIYEEWFVHFRFPGHEQVKMVESELGLIPEGWKVERLGDVIEFKKGKKPASVSNQCRTGLVPHLLIDALRGTNNPDFVTTEKMVIATPSDTIMVMDGSGSCDIFIGHEGVIGSTLGRYRVSKLSSLSPYWLHLFFVSHLKEIKTKNVGAAIPHANKDFINGMTVPLPTNEVSDRFDQIVLPIFEFIRLMRTKNANLRATRDLLLPKLISGELDVSSLPEPEEVITA